MQQMFKLKNQLIQVAASPQRKPVVDGTQEAPPRHGEPSRPLIDQSERWQRGERIPAENYLRRYPPLETDAEAVVELAYGEFLLREEHGELPTLAELLWRFPNHQARLRQPAAVARGLRLENKSVYSRRAKKNFWARPGGPESQNFPSRRE